MTLEDVQNLAGWVSEQFQTKEIAIDEGSFIHWIDFINKDGFYCSIECNIVKNFYGWFEPIAEMTDVAFGEKPTHIFKEIEPFKQYLQETADI